MNQFNVTIPVNAESAEQAEVIGNALSVLLHNLGAENIENLSAAIIENPNLINKALKVAKNPFVKKAFNAM